MSQKKVLGLDLGTNSIGFALLGIDEKKNEFEEIVSNSIIFPTYETAEDRRNARSARRQHDRKRRRNKNARTLLAKYNLANKKFIKNPTLYLEDLKLSKNPYELREQAVEGKELTKDEFTFALYSILTRRGYSNQFKVEENEEDGIINKAISKNKSLAKNYAIPSMVLTEKKKKLQQDGFVNVNIRNKGENYNNSLDRELWETEANALIASQKNSRTLFATIGDFEKFEKEFKNCKFFSQRPLKSTEKMVGFCQFYNKFHPEFNERRMPKANILNIEFTLRQRIENSQIINKKTGEHIGLDKKQIDAVVEFWLKTPSANKITTKNIFKPIDKDLIIHISENQDDTVLDITLHRQIVDILKDIDIFKKEFDFYCNVLNIMHNYANISQREEKINAINNNLLSKETIKKLANAKKGSGGLYSSFSAKFASEILLFMRDGEKYQNSLEKLGFFSKYLNMKPYSYLPPLDPSKQDIEWLKKHVQGFETKHIFYQPLVSPIVKRIISILRKLINELIKKYGKIDKIVIESARELNSKKDEERYKKSQSKNRKFIKEAEDALKAHKLETTSTNIEKMRLLIEQKDICPYSGVPITMSDFDDVEIEHFIPRSKIFINSNKNRILVYKKENRDKNDLNPINFLGTKFDDFAGRVKEKLTNKEKIKWLTDKEVINSAYNNEKLSESFLNDTRSATKIVANYLAHYLYPSKNKHKKGEKLHVFSVTGKATHTLKKAWGIDKIEPRNEEGKKDRMTNYHHVTDAIIIALTSNSIKQNINTYFKQLELKRSDKRLQKVSDNIPTQKGKNTLHDFIKDKIKSYENDSYYVCYTEKRKQNLKGFKDGNAKLVLSKDGKMIELETKSINPRLLLDNYGKELDEKRVDDVFDTIIKRLDVKKQKNIIEALQRYEKTQLELRSEIKNLQDSKKELLAKRPNRKDVEISKDLQNGIDAVTFEIEQKESEKNIPCFFVNKNGKKQYIRKLKLPKDKETSADIVITTDKSKKGRIERLNSKVLKTLQDSKTPYVAKQNDTILSVDLYNTTKGQIVGLNYFSSIKNDIKSKISPKKVEFIKDYSDKMTIYRGDILEITNSKENTKNLYIFNGGGNISRSNNAIEVKTINAKNAKRIFVTLNNKTVVKKVNLDYFGNISYI